MTTSGLNPWMPTIGDVIDEAFEQAGIDPATATARHLSSAIRSVNMTYLWLENKAEALFRDDIETIKLKAGQPFFFAPQGTLSIKKGMIYAQGEPPSQANNLDVYAKGTWFDMPNKGQIGRPSILALNYSAPVFPDGLITDTQHAIGTTPPENAYGEEGYGDFDYGMGQPQQGQAYTPEYFGPQVICWPVPDRDYILSYTRVRATQETTQLGQDMDVRRIWTNAVTFKLASLLALKFNRNLFDKLDRLAEDSRADTNMNNRETADVRMNAVSMSVIRRGRRRW